MLLIHFMICFRCWTTMYLEVGQNIYFLVILKFCRLLQALIAQEYFPVVVWWCIICAGKLNRGLSVIDSYSLLNDGKELTSDEIFKTSALGWCIEWVCKINTFNLWLMLYYLVNRINLALVPSFFFSSVWLVQCMLQLQAYFLVLDDIMDGSHTRRGQPCWYKLEKVWAYTGITVCSPLCFHAKYLLVIIFSLSHFCFNASYRLAWLQLMMAYFFATTSREFWRTTSGQCLIMLIF